MVYKFACAKPTITNGNIKTIKNIQDKIREYYIDSFNRIYHLNYTLKEKEEGRNIDINVDNMNKYKKFQTLSGKLNWSHYCELLSIVNYDERNFYEKDINAQDDGNPIGIIVCVEKEQIALEYDLGGLSNNIFASTYNYYISNKKQLIYEVEKVLGEL